MTGLSAISVQVVADATGPAGQRRRGPRDCDCRVRRRTPRQTLTDRNGRALLLGLAKGRVRLSVTHQSYLNATYGQERPGDAGTFMPIGGEQTIGPITIRMKRGATIAGVVTTESGDPLVGVKVEACRRGFEQAARRFLDGGSDVTDDRGAYRISGLQPGDYLIGILPRYLDGTHGDDAIWDPNDADSGVEFSAGSRSSRSWSCPADAASPSTTRRRCRARPPPTASTGIRGDVLSRHHAGGRGADQNRRRQNSATASTSSWRPCPWLTDLWRRRDWTKGHGAERPRPVEPGVRASR